MSTMTIAQDVPMLTITSDRPRELGAFLRARRNDIHAARSDAGGRTRRVPGLRREEVSTRAGISVDYYTRLEQGREPNPSAQVIEALARALRLDPVQRRYAYTLAGLAAPPRVVPDDALLPTAFLALVEEQRMPAFVLGPHLDILASSSAYRQLFARFTSHNLLEMLFLDDGARGFFLDWNGCARWAVTLLRVLSADATPTEAGLALVRRLTSDSSDFAALWAAHAVEIAATHRMGVRHEQFGEISLHVFALELVGHPGRRLVLCRPTAHEAPNPQERAQGDRSEDHTAMRPSIIAGTLVRESDRAPLARSIHREQSTR
jgi:transcriptional regulator with XRE-family HTH domain